MNTCGVEIDISIQMLLHLLLLIVSSISPIWNNYQEKPWYVAEPFEFALSNPIHASLLQCNSSSNGGDLLKGFIKATPEIPRKYLLHTPLLCCPAY